MSAPRTFGSGTDYDISARTVFRGDDTRLVLQSGSSWPTDELGVTTMTRRWKCRRDLAQNFAPRRGDVDFLFRGLKVIDFDATDEGAMTTLSVRYNGFLNSKKAGPVLERRSTQVLEVTLYPSESSDVSGSLTLVYLAPVLTRMWASTKPPEFANPFDFNGFNEPIKRLYFRNSQGISIEGGNDAIMSLFDTEERSVRTQADSAPEGHVYRNTEVIQRQIVQVAHVDDATSVLNFISGES